MMAFFLRYRYDGVFFDDIFTMPFSEYNIDYLYHVPDGTSSVQTSWIPPVAHLGCNLNFTLPITNNNIQIL